MLKANAAASKKAGTGAGSTASSSNGRVSLLQLTALSGAGQSGGGESFVNNSAECASLRQSPLLIVDVWASNVRDVFSKIMWTVDDYPYVALDTEFPGVVARPLTTAAGAGKNLAAYHYQTIKLNVDMLRLLQLGLCFCNEQGEVAGAAGSSAPSSGAAGSQQQVQGGGVCYQFHFKFSLEHDMYAQDSIDVLAAAGLDFARHAREGIDVSEFAELLMTSGVILNEDIRWLTFHGGFDFAYLLHVLIGGGQGGGGGDAGSGTALPASEADFFELMALYFPCMYDVKALARHLPAAAAAQHPQLASEVQHGGLDRLASTLRLARIGRAHQAGSDALLTAAAFFKLRELFFADIIPPTVSQLQQAAAAAAAATATSPSVDSPKDSLSKEKEKEKEKAESLSSAAGEAASSALVSRHASHEERYLNRLYGLAPTANALLRAQREKERSQTSDVGTAAAAARNDNEGAASILAANSRDLTRNRSPARSPSRSPDR